MRRVCHGSTYNLEMTFEEAVAAPGKLAQMWGERMADGNRVQAIYSLSGDGAKQLAWRAVSAEQHDKLTGELTARGINVAETEPTCDFIWIISAGSVEVYSRRAKVLDASGDRAVLDVGGPVLRNEIARVFAFAEPDHVYRGIKAELRSGKEVALVTEVSAAAEAGAGYSRNDLLMEAGWTSTLGSAVANWAGASFESWI
jgi:hypothetical protein